MQAVLLFPTSSGYRTSRTLHGNLDEVNKMLQKIMLTAFNEVYALSQEKNVTLRMAAYMVAIKRITTAGKLRGGPISMG